MPSTPRGKARAREEKGRDAECTTLCAQRQRKQEIPLRLDAFCGSEIELRRAFFRFSFFVRSSFVRRSFVVRFSVGGLSFVPGLSFVRFSFAVRSPFVRRSFAVRSPFVRRSFGSRFSYDESIFFTRWSRFFLRMKPGFRVLRSSFPASRVLIGVFGRVGE